MVEVGVSDSINDFKTPVSPHVAAGLVKAKGSLARAEAKLDELEGTV